VAADLRPVALDDLGLIEALNAFAAELNRRHKIAFDVHAAGFTDRLSPKIENAVFRIVQEAFTNILKHSAATSASIIIEKHDDVLKIVIEDDGCGFELNFDAHRPEGNFKKWGANIGLSSIRERLAILDGRFRIETAVGHGVTLFIEIPLVREPVYS
jgi:signal transduction histidine kinase